MKKNYILILKTMINIVRKTMKLTFRTGLYVKRVLKSKKKLKILERSTTEMKAEISLLNDSSTVKINNL